MSDEYYKMVLLSYALFFGGVLCAAFVFLYRTHRIRVFCGMSAFLLGFMVYVVFSTIRCVSQDIFYENIDGAQVLYFTLGNAVALSIILLIYIFWKPKKTYGKNTKFFNTRVPVSLIVGIVIGSILGLKFLPNVPGLGRLIFMFSTYLAMFSWALACHRWYRKKTSVVNIGLLIAAGSVNAMAIFFAGFSRQPILAFVLVPVIVFYFSGFRIMTFKKLLAFIIPVGLIGLLLLGAWTSTRVIVMQESKGLSLAEAMSLRIDLFFTQFAKVDPYEFILTSVGDNSTAVALAAVENYVGRDAVFEKDPFNAFYFALSNPVPRAFWANKPLSLGTILPRDMGVWEDTGYVNWGPTIIGHSAHEGGFHMIVFYASLIGILLRRFDHFLEFNYLDSLCVAIFAVAFVRLFAFLRGDFGVYAIGLFIMFLAFHSVRLVRNRLRLERG